MEHLSSVTKQSGEIDISPDYRQSEDFISNIFNDFKNCIIQGILVANLTYRLALEMNIPEEEAYVYKMAGLLHDIGKLRLSQYLYGRNSGNLLIEVTKYKRMHPAISYEILSREGFERDVAETVHRHHECFDGSGYPDNLSGEHIPRGARLMRITDEFVDLITDRPYRKAFDIEAAVDIMIEEIKNLDLEAFIAFQRMIHNDDVLMMISNSKICLDDLRISDILDI